MTVTDAATGSSETTGGRWGAEVLRRADPQLADLLAAEAERRSESIQLLAGRTSPARRCSPPSAAR